MQNSCGLEIALDHIVKAARRKYTGPEGARGPLAFTAHDIVTYGPEPILSNETPRLRYERSADALPEPAFTPGSRRE
jgi:hypothetical protein